MSEEPQKMETTEKVENEAEKPAPSAEEVLTAKLAESEQKYKYLYAEFENFKKRAVKERQEVAKFGIEGLVSDLLPVFDNLDRALQFAKPDTDPSLLAGLKMVAQQFKKELEKQGVAEIPSVGQAFNPELHESVGEQKSDQAKGTIIQEQLKGYTIHGRLLRASQVILSAGN